MDTKAYNKLVIAGANPSVVELFARLCGDQFSIEATIAEKMYQEGKVSDIGRAMADIVEKRGYPNVPVQSPNKQESN